MEEVILAALLTDGGVSGLVGTRVYWDERPQGDPLPAIVMHNITGRRDYHFQGPSGLVASMVQVSIWADLASTTKAVSDAVVARLSGYAVDSPTEIQGAFVRSERSGKDSSEPADQSKFYRHLDLEVWHAE